VAVFEVLCELIKDQPLLQKMFSIKINGFVYKFRSQNLYSIFYYIIRRHLCGVKELETANFFKKAAYIVCSKWKTHIYARISLEENYCPSLRNLNTKACEGKVTPHFVSLPSTIYNFPSKFSSGFPTGHVTHQSQTLLF